GSQDVPHQKPHGADVSLRQPDIERGRGVGREPGVPARRFHVPVGKERGERDAETGAAALVLMRHDSSSSSGSITYSATGTPPIRCSWMIRSSTAGVQEWYQTPSGYTTAIGPSSQTRRQLALVR